MARSTFGGFGGDQVSLDPAGNSGFYKAAANYTTGTFWSASTGGTQYTDLIDPVTSVALAGVSTDAHGHVVPFKGPDGIIEGWLDFGGGRFKVTATQAALFAPSTRLINPGTGLSGGGDLTADRALAVAYGTTAGTAAQGNDSRLSDARTPLTHATTHASGGSDPVTPAAIGAAPQNLTGTYASRPAAIAVTAGTLYYATDVPEVYRSNATAWTPVGSGGSELAYAQITTAFTTTSTTAVDVTGLSVTCVVGERPVMVIFDGEVQNSVSLAYVRGYITVDGTAGVNFGGPVNGTNDYHPSHREQRVSGLTPGSTHTFKIQVASVSGGGTSQIYGSATDPAFIQVVTL